MAMKMMMVFMISSLAALFMTIPLAKNPVSLLLLILLISLWLAGMFSMVMASWYAFLVFLIYVSGMLVMFAYFVSMTPNQHSMSIKPTLTWLMVIFIPTLAYFSTSEHFTYLSPMNQQMTDMYLPENSYILIGITLILLMTMIVVVKLTKLTKGPLRTFM